jgi:hypothetical protein
VSKGPSWRIHSVSMSQVRTRVYRNRRGLFYCYCCWGPLQLVVVIAGVISKVPSAAAEIAFRTSVIIVATRARLLSSSHE